MQFNKELVDLLKQRHKKEEERPKQITDEQREKNLINWTSFYRRNINLYATQRLGIRLHPFQHIMLYLMGVSQLFMSICSRGLSKSFICALFAICKCLLYPYSEVHLTASTINQAKKMVTDKMDRELCNKLSPILKYMKDNGLIKFHVGKDEITVDFLINGSKIWVDVADDSARGGRSTLLIYEECRLLKKGIIDSVFEKMAHPRQAKFLQNPKYAGDPRWIEECQSIYITSARTKSEWFFNTFKTIVGETYNNHIIPYNFFAGDIFLSIIFGLKTKSDYFKAKKTSGELDFMMEDLNIMLGESEDAFFKRESFKKNQIIQTAFRKPTYEQIISKKQINRPKRENEYRLLFIDYAFANTTSSKSANDHTVIGCMYGLYEDEVLHRGVDCIFTHDAGDSIGTEKLIRELFWQYQADYIVMDSRNGGENFFDHLTQTYEHPQLGKFWNNHGFTVVPEESLNVVPKAKIDDLINRTVDPQAIPCIIPIIGTSDLNSIMWIELQKRLTNNEISFLIDDMDYEIQLNDREDYFELTTEEKAELKYPYAQTMLMINEAVNLKQEWRDGRVKLSEPRTGYKDRIVALSYGNYIMTLLENKLNIKNQQDLADDDVDWDNISLVV